jgi:hypothetical protein
LKTKGIAAGVTGLMPAAMPAAHPFSRPDFLLTSTTNHRDRRPRDHRTFTCISGPLVLSGVFMAFAHVFFSVEDVVIQVVRLFDVRDALAFVSVRHHVFRVTA